MIFRKCAECPISPEYNLSIIVLNLIYSVSDFCTTQSDDRYSKLLYDIHVEKQRERTWLRTV
jgi:hypothetical protein